MIQLIFILDRLHCGTDSAPGPIDRLYKAVLEAKDADPSSSGTAQLLRAGRGKIAEEATEVALQKHRDTVVPSSADLLFSLVVLWDSVQVAPKHVWNEMNRRVQLFGIAEKLAKPRGVPKARRKLCINGLQAIGRFIGTTRSGWSEGFSRQLGLELLRLQPDSPDSVLTTNPQELATIIGLLVRSIQKIPL